MATTTNNNPVSRKRRPNKKLEALLDGTEQTIKEARRDAERSGLVHQTNTGGSITIEQGGDLDASWRLKQRDIVQDSSVDINSAAKAMSLRFPNSGDYALDWTPNGRYMVMGSSKGHLAVVDALRFVPRAELTLKDDVVRDVAFFHNETLFAAAQRKYVFVYSGKSGVEIHKLKSHIEPTRLTFLRYHMLLTSVSRSGWIHYQDVSTGDVVSSLRSKMGPCHVLEQNPMDAIIATGHDSGIVARWAPSQGEALVKMMCHKGPVCAVSFDSQQHMITAGLDGKVTVWDARKFGKLFSYDTHSRFPANCLAVSQRGLLAWSSGSEIKIWKDAISQKQSDPYLIHRVGEGHTITSLQFRPYEDVLGVGHSGGIDTLLVPGAGEANYDVFEANPFARPKQRNETEVHQLLDKVPWDSIGLGFLDGGVKLGEVRQKERNSHNMIAKKPLQVKNKMKGRGKIGAKLKAKSHLAGEEERAKMRAKNEGRQNDKSTMAAEELGPALRRFM